MKAHIIPVLLTCSMLPLAVTSCSTTSSHPDSAKTSQTESSTKPAQADKTRAILIGLWANEGELARIRFKEDGTCVLGYDEAHGARDIEITGTWTHQGNILRVHYDKKWWGSGKNSTQTYYLKTGKQHTLWLDPNRDTSFAFYRAGD